MKNQIIFTSRVASLWRPDASPSAPMRECPAAAARAVKCVAAESGWGRRVSDPGEILWADLDAYLCDAAGLARRNTAGSSARRAQHCQVPHLAVACRPINECDALFTLS